MSDLRCEGVHQAGGEECDLHVVPRSVVRRTILDRRTISCSSDATCSCP
jgi:hypothetical protein